ncbi:orotidine-5'-phosphate decarboxylase [Candidatus Vesicomyidisocius calyptogenae]|uniref:Orotidine 5'-phosphate decarboxylase n=1 Tax=Vesicomyosocius okutanii subsp. Calyptogena okutanii (strain HA) TaxID=412965 RepID=A5CX06_VESOH|nr:orotidine-5'-phosphate decarboxylase [Candidatus Vesicomyosocius okutanii]BAF61521.1 orotidine-5'-phosphate decarboxylase [Candidatus Vesicomyosocius okutanii]
MKNIKVENRLIFALDVSEIKQAKDLVIQLDNSINFYKIGMELLMTGQYFNLLDWLLEKDKQVFVDLKFFDVPETVGRTIKRLSQYGATFVTIHGNQALMEKANENKYNLKILAVTALTSIDRGDLDDLGFNCDVLELVVSRAKRAFEAGCDGVVSSGLEVPFLRKYVDSKLIVVTPGIRPVVNDDDQKRIVDVVTAFNSGSDYIVVGRPIKNATSPYQAATDIQTIIKGCF